MATKNTTPILIKLDGSIVDTVAWIEDSLEVKTFVERLATSYDTDVIIQRDANWPLDMKVDLILSMMTGTPIGSCLLCENPKNVANKNVIDFKNRAITIKEFWNGEFSVPLRLEKENDSFEDKDMTWRDIVNSENSQLKNLKEKFEQYKVKCIVYSNMNLLQQAEKFLQVNTQLPMENEELLYGSKFWAKGFFRVAHKLVLEKLLYHTTNNLLSKNIKEKGTIFIHRVIYTCFGSKFDDVWAIRDLGNSKSGSSSKPLVTATSEFNNELSNAVTKDTYNIDKKFVEESKYSGKIKILKKCCDSLYNVLNCKNKSSKKILQNDMFDCIIFFMKKILEERLTFSMMDEYPETYLQIIINYIEAKKLDPAIRGQSVTKKKIQQRLELFENIWAKISKDDGIKNQRPNPTQISLAYLKSGSACPITGDSLDGDTCVEHNDAKCKSSKTNFSIVSKRGNKWKSDLSLEQTERILVYQKANRQIDENAS